MAVLYMFTPDGWFRRVLTYGKTRPPKMDPCHKITKKKLDNPHLWAQLDAVSRGSFVNHLNHRHFRNPKTGK